MVVDLYINEWIQQITEVTDVAHATRALVLSAELDGAHATLPLEKPYPCTGHALSPDAPLGSSSTGDNIA